MNNDVFLHNMVLLATHPLDQLQVDRDGVTLRKIERQDLSVDTAARGVLDVVKEMRATSSGRPAWIIEAVGVKADIIFNRILGTEPTPLAASDYEKRKTFTFKVKNEEGEEVEVHAERDLLVQNCQVMAGLDGIEGAFALPGIKKSTLEKILSFLGTDSPNFQGLDTKQLCEIFDAAHYLGYDKLMSRIAGKFFNQLAKSNRTEQQQIMISLASSANLLEGVTQRFERFYADYKYAISGETFVENPVPNMLRKPIDQINQEIDRTSEEINTLPTDSEEYTQKTKRLTNLEASLHILKKMATTFVNMGWLLELDPIHFIPLYTIPENVLCADLGRRNDEAYLDDATLKQVLNLCPNIKKLTIYGQRHLTELPPITKNQLEELDCRACNQLQSLPPEYTKLRQIQYTGLTDADGIERFNPPKQLPETYTNLERCGFERGTLEEFKSRDFWLARHIPLDRSRPF